METKKRKPDLAFIGVMFVAVLAVAANVAAFCLLWFV